METSKSLLRRAQSGPQDEAWNRLIELYEPLIQNWLRRFSVPEDEAADISQEVLLALSQDLATFDHSGRNGAFRSWLKNITINRCRRYWDAKKRRPQPAGQVGLVEVLEQLEDPASDLSRRWDQEHDDHVLRQLIQMLDVEFDQAAMRVFRRIALEGAAPADVADELEIPVAHVYKAKFRVMQRLREEAEGLIDA